MPFNDKGEFIRRPPASAPAAPASDGSLEEALGVLLGLVMVAGLIWLVVVFREWIGAALVLWGVGKLLLKLF